MKVPEIKKENVIKNLQDALETFEEKSREYGDGYQVMPKTLIAMFPQGVELESEDDFSRFASLLMCTTKLTRYASTFHNGGHKDSAHDLITYAAFLEAKTDGKR